MKLLHRRFKAVNFILFFKHTYKARILRWANFSIILSAVGLLYRSTDTTMTFWAELPMNAPACFTEWWRSLTSHSCSISRHEASLPIFSPNRVALHLRGNAHCAISLFENYRFPNLVVAKCEQSLLRRIQASKRRCSATQAVCISIVASSASDQLISQNRATVPLYEMCGSRSSA